MDSFIIVGGKTSPRPSAKIMRRKARIPLYTTAEAAAFLGLSLRGMKKRVEVGKAKPDAVKGHIFLFSLASLLKMPKNQAIKGRC